MPGARPGTTAVHRQGKVTVRIARPMGRRTCDVFLLSGSRLRGAVVAVSCEGVGGRRELFTDRRFFLNTLLFTGQWDTGYPLRTALSQSASAQNSAFQRKIECREKYVPLVT